MLELHVAPLVWVDIENIRQFTLARFGSAKLAEYNDLIDEAFDDIRVNPRIGRVGRFGGYDVFQYPIRNPGRKARHVLCYRRFDESTILAIRLLHDAADFRRHL